MTENITDSENKVKLYPKVCVYCKKPFTALRQTKMYCCFVCRNSYHNIIRRNPRELFKLTKHERMIYDEYHGIGGDNNEPRTDV